MSELKPDSEKKEERLSDKEKVNTEKTNAEELNAEEPNAEEPNAEEINEEPPAASEDEDFFFDDNKAYEARRAARLERRNKLRRRKKRLRIAGCIVVAAAAAIGIGIGFYGEELQNFVSEQQVKIAQMVKSADRKTEEEKTAQQTNAEAEAENAVTPEVQDTDGLSEEDKTLYRQAKYAAKQYDYDKAISMLQNSETYQTSEKFQHAVKVYQKKKESCVSWPLDQVTHVFYHTLIKDTGKAFDGDYKSGDYDQVMTTIDEFNQITQSMYDKGYVMVSIYDMATADENGNMNAGEILLPPGKVPFVLSQDDVCYYHYMDGDGFATKLIVDEEGKIRNEYVEDAEELNAEKPNAEKPNVEKLNEEKPNTEEIDEEPPAASEDEDFFFDDNKAYEARRAARLERRNKLRRRKKRLRIAGCIVVAAAAAIGIGIGFYGEELQNFVSEQQVKIAQMVKSADRKTEEEKTAQQTNAEAEAENAVTPEVQDTDGLSEEDKTLYRQAKYAAKQYDYDKAISMLQNSETYQTSEKFQHAVKVYQKKKESCVSWPLDQVTHVFYHTLIKDTGKAFDGDYKSGDYDQVMTTIDEFNQITQSMYDKGYVMVSIYDMATADENGNMNAGEILLPPGKVPFVLSQDDVCYYHYMDGDGFATKLIVDEEGKIRNEYVEDDGSISVGDYDMVPLIDRFVEEHPDFSYRGAKGIVALTGYNGILGYRTDSSYETRPDDLDADKVKWLDEHPDFNLNTERENAARVAQAMKDEGWLFASHTWGHQNVSQISLERLQADTQKFKENVDPLIGGTDIIIFAFGADLTSVEDYSGEKFEYLKSQGYNYYCNVDSSQYFVQIRSNYFRQGRRNLDGYRMYYNPELLSDLFDAQSVFDSSRPVPVPTMG